MSSPLLEVHELAKHYPVKLGPFRTGMLQALFDVSFDVGVRQTLAIVGESGSGKSTLARQLLMLEKPDHGSLHHKGELLRWPQDVRSMQRRTRMIFQNPFESLNPRKQIYALLEEPLINHASDSAADRRERIYAMLDSVGLNPNQANRYPHMFSGGQRQRIAIARALIIGPELLIADEAVSALDVSVQAQVLNLLLDLIKAHGLSCIFITHDISVVEVMADDVLVLYMGRVMEYGRADEVLTKPMHHYTKTLLDCTPRFDRSGMRAMDEGQLAGDIPSSLNPPSGCVFHTRCRHVQERCRVEQPVLVEHEGRRLACHLPVSQRMAK